MTTSADRIARDGANAAPRTTDRRLISRSWSVMARSDRCDTDSMIPAARACARCPTGSQAAVAQQRERRRQRQTAHDRRIERDRRREPDPELLELEQRER